MKHRVRISKEDFVRAIDLNMGPKSAAPTAQQFPAFIELEGELVGDEKLQLGHMTTSEVGRITREYLAPKNEVTDKEIHLHGKPMNLSSALVAPKNECCGRCRDWAENPKARENTCLQCPCHKREEKRYNCWEVGRAACFHQGERGPECPRPSKTPIERLYVRNNTGCACKGICAHHAYYDRELAQKLNEVIDALNERTTWKGLNEAYNLENERSSKA